MSVLSISVENSSIYSTNYSSSKKFNSPNPTVDKTVGTEAGRAVVSLGQFRQQHASVAGSTTRHGLNESRFNLSLDTLHVISGSRRDETTY